jgi:hypothetical protein
MEGLFRLPKVDLYLKLVALYVDKDQVLWRGSRDRAKLELVSVRLALLRSAAGEVGEDRDRAEGSWRHRHCIYKGGRRMRVESAGGLFSMCELGFWHVQAKVLACVSQGFGICTVVL